MHKCYYNIHVGRRVGRRKSLFRQAKRSSFCPARELGNDLTLSTDKAATSYPRNRNVGLIDGDCRSLDRIPLLSSIFYIYKEESLCVCVRYAFSHRTTDFDETFQELSLHPGGGRHLLGSKKERTLRVLQATF